MTGLQEVANAIDEMVTKGQIIDAAEKYFAPNTRTIEFDGTMAEGKQPRIKTLNDIASSMRKMRGIALRRSMPDDNVSFPEYIFSFRKEGWKQGLFA